MPTQNRTTKPTGGEPPVRYAIYARYSTHMQSDATLESQEMMCRRAIAERGGVVVDVYTDAAVMGWTLDRDGFVQMRDAASKKKFSAVMMWKFDRLARDHTHVTMIKTLFRREYGVKLYCVEGFSEDDDDSPYAAMMEQMMGVMSSFYSRNLSNEVRRGIVYRHEQGKYNGDWGPLGYILATEKEPKTHRAVKASESMPLGLHVVPREAALVRRAFKMYATGECSYRQIADYLNTKSKYLNLSGDRITVSWVREMLINRLYLGEVSYSDVVYKDGFRQSRKSHRDRRIWRPGIHQAIITPELFDACEQARLKRRKSAGGGAPKHPYLLAGKLWCGYCLERRLDAPDDKNYGKMHSYTNTGAPTRDRRCRCVSQRRGYEKCGQKSVKCCAIESQVVEALFEVSKSMPADIEAAINDELGKRAQNAAQIGRMNEIRDIIKRIDTSWEHGFISQEEYLQRRRDLQVQIDALIPIDYEDMRKNAIALKSFAARWENTKDVKEQQRLIDAVVKAVVVKGKRVTAIVLHGDTPVLLEQNVGHLGTTGLVTQRPTVLGCSQAKWLQAA